MNLARNMIHGSANRPATAGDVRQVVDRIIAELLEDRARLDAAAEVAVRIRVVPTVDDLPAEAEATEWFRVVATPALVYVGNGTGRPLSKFTTTAL